MFGSGALGGRPATFVWGTITGDVMPGDVMPGDVCRVALLLAPLDLNSLRFCRLFHDRCMMNALS